MSSVLLTGAAGFLGPHVADALAARGHAVLGADLRPAAGAFAESLVVGGARALEAVVAERRPEVIVHGAFINRKPPAWSEREYLDQMLASNLSLLEAAAAAGSRLLLVSSSAVYGAGGGAEVIDERCPPQPVSLYGVAKAAQELLAGFAAAARGLSLSTLRLFNLCGPGQALGMLIPDWVSRVVAIARGGEPVLRVPTTRTSRDFVDVRDAARAIAVLVERWQPGATVNAASGRALGLAEMADHLRALCPVRFAIEETAPAPDGSNVAAQRGSFERLRAGWGWAPEIDWRRSLTDVWQEWLARPAA
jgi:nucleoside-diphosphate-sugar epimerase